MSSGPRQSPTPLPQPGEILHHDFRPKQRRALPSGGVLKLMTWNIERGYKLDAVIEELRRLDPDVVAIQACARCCMYWAGSICTEPACNMCMRPHAK